MVLLAIRIPWLELAKELCPCLTTLPRVAPISRHEKQMTGAADGCMALIPRKLIRLKFYHRSFVADRFHATYGGTYGKHASFLK